MADSGNFTPGQIPPATQVEQDIYSVTGGFIEEILERVVEVADGTSEQIDTPDPRDGHHESPGCLGELVGEDTDEMVEERVRVSEYEEMLREESGLAEGGDAPECGPLVERTVSGESSGNANVGIGEDGMCRLDDMSVDEGGCGTDRITDETVERRHEDEEIAERLPHGDSVAVDIEKSSQEESGSLMMREAVIGQETSDGLGVVNGDRTKSHDEGSVTPAEGSGAQEPHSPTPVPCSGDVCYSNGYKVCRYVTPDLKQCHILETGETISCHVRKDHVIESGAGVDREMSPMDANASSERNVSFSNKSTDESREKLKHDDCASVRRSSGSEDARVLNELDESSSGSSTSSTADASSQFSVDDLLTNDDGGGTSVEVSRGLSDDKPAKQHGKGAIARANGGDSELDGSMQTKHFIIDTSNVDFNKLVPLGGNAVLYDSQNTPLEFELGNKDNDNRVKHSGTEKIAWFGDDVSENMTTDISSDILTERAADARKWEVTTDVAQEIPYTGLVSYLDAMGVKEFEEDKLLQSDSEMMPLLMEENNVNLGHKTSKKSASSSSEQPKMSTNRCFNFEQSVRGPKTENVANTSSLRDRQISGTSTERIATPVSLPISVARDRDTSDPSKLNTSVHDLDMSALHRAEKWLDGSHSSREQSQTAMSFRSSTEFSTLQEQQTSWMQMFKLLETQHEHDLQSQYEQHRRNVRRIQQEMEEDLLRQQENFTKKLNNHRDFLLVSAIKSPHVGYEPSLGDANLSTIVKSPNETLYGRYKPGDLIQGGDSPASRLDTSAKRSLTFENVSRPATPEAVVNSALVRGMGGKAVSTPVTEALMHADKPPHLSAYIPRVFTDDDLYKTPPKYRPSPHATPHADKLAEYHTYNGTSTSESDLSLREKHAKHLADLHNYYESELHELRSAITTASPNAHESPYRTVMEENLKLHSQLDEVEEDLNTTLRKNKTHESRIQALQIRTEEQMVRHETAQKQIASLHNSVDELTIDRKQMEAVIEDHCVKNEQLSAMLKQAYKTQDDQIHERKRDGTSYQKLMVKYEAAARETEANKCILVNLEGKLYDARSEIVELKRVVSRLELENKRLSRESDNYQHQKRVSNISDSILMMSHDRDSLDSGDNAAVSRGSPLRGEQHGDRLSSFMPVEGAEDVRSMTPARQPTSYLDHLRKSPLLRAESELQRLRKVVRGSVGTVPSYSTSTPRMPTRLEPSTATQEHDIDTLVTSVHRTFSSPQPVTIINAPLAKQPASVSHNAPGVRSPVRFDVDLNSSDSSARKKGGKIPKKKATKRKDDKLRESVADTLQRVKSGEIIARPAWENTQTSVAVNSSPTNKHVPSPVKVPTRDERLQRHLHTVQDLEKMYDHLQAQKVQMESALSKLPTNRSCRYRSRSQQEELETRLDQVERELGSVRMSLKRYNVIKSSV